jgi:hypothetical protein
MFEAIPAVDLKDERCVQLVQGTPGTELVSLPDPVSIAREYYITFTAVSSAGPIILMMLVPTPQFLHFIVRMLVDVQMYVPTINLCRPRQVLNRFVY